MKSTFTRQWWHTPLIPALGRQRQVDFFSFLFFLLGIFLIYIFNAIPKVPIPTPPIPYPPTPPFWPSSSPVLGHIKFASPMGLSFQWWPTRPSFDTYAAKDKSSRVLVSSYFCSTYRVAVPFSCICIKRWPSRSSLQREAHWTWNTDFFPASLANASRTTE